MRALTAAIALVVLPGLAIAQESRSPGTSLPSIGLPLPQIGLPLPQIGLPLPQIGLPPATSAPVRAHRPVRRPERGGGRRSARPSPVVYLVPAYANYQVGTPVDLTTREGAEPIQPEPSPVSTNTNRPAGILYLDLEPAADTQVYVDGSFIGTVTDTGGELALEAGTHNVEFRAPGYEAISVNVRIEANRAITYRDALQPTAQATAARPVADTAASPAVARKPFYLIPGCYLGDVPPKDAGLPKTCDPARAITMWP